MHPWLGLRASPYLYVRLTSKQGWVFHPLARVSGSEQAFGKVAKLSHRRVSIHSSHGEACTRGYVFSASVHGEPKL